MTEPRSGKRVRDQDDEPFQLEGKIEPSEDTREEIGEFIEEQRRFQDDIRLVALFLGIDFFVD